MQMLNLKLGRYDRDERRRRFMIYRQRRYFRSEEYHDTYVRKTQDLWLLGPPQCGKTSAIERILTNALQLWPTWPLLHCRGTDPLSRWTDQPALAEHLSSQGQALKSLGSEERIDALLCWAKQVKLNGPGF
jgi:hypothetical protein